MASCSGIRRYRVRISPKVRSFNFPKILSMPEAIRFYSEKFGPYPFCDEKYTMASCEFAGGMERDRLVDPAGVGSPVSADG